MPRGAALPATDAPRRVRATEEGTMTDPVALTAELIRCPSVTPAEGGAIALLDARLAAAGFRTVRVDRGGIANLYARWGTDGPVVGFNGHTDVVPPGDVAAWRRDPFGGEVAEGAVHGRGAADMKSGVAAFVAAAIDFVAATPPAGSVALLITGDEEGEATDGTAAILAWMAATGERLDHCLVGEPTSAERTGDAIKIGRRGSLTARLTAYGVQGHAAYPEKARNPLPALVRLLDRLAARRLDDGTAHFGPSTLALTTIDVGNPASNVIPAEARATLNVRFNDAHTGQGLCDWIETEADRAAAEFGVGIAARFEIAGESFVTEPGPLTELVARAVEAETGLRPKLSTTGGTSDARFVKDHCPVVEVGLHGPTMHQVDERVATADVETLKRVYDRILADYFVAGGLRV
jgi:succinyl-diaminopimelate desuccinylase